MDRSAIPLPRAAEPSPSSVVWGRDWRHERLALTSEHPVQLIDITDLVAATIERLQVRVGLVNVQALHTTTAIVVNEHEPLLHADFADLLSRVAPAHEPYRHDDVRQRTVNLTPDERVNGHAHCRALLLPTSACLNVVNGRLLLGRWQRLFFVELDGPQDRHLSVLIMGAGRGEMSR
jgi:secondary thiamine-phosphate synthase enzyme